MSLQHRKLAEIWAHLQGRHDIANILREIIGQHSINSTIEQSDTTEEAVRTIIYIKAIYDLQRAYLSSTSTGTSELPPYVFSCLLPPELLFSSILYLVQVKERSFSRSFSSQRELTRPRLILAQTILSGLRLILLRKENLPAQDKRRLQSAINAAWQNDRLVGVERFIVLDLFAEILDSINEASGENPYQKEWDNARLPTYAAGLYPLDIRVETFVTPLIHGTMEEDWIDAYWILFDCLWAVECAVTQRFVDLNRQTGVLDSNQLGIDTDETLEQLYHTRTSLIISIFHITGPMTPTPALLDSLAITLLDWNDDLDSFLSRQNSLLQLQSSSRTTPSQNLSYSDTISEMMPYYEMAWSSFAEWLSSRKSGYEQFSIRRTGVTSNDLQEMVKEWVGRMTSPAGETLSKELEGAYLPVYVVDCPKLHVIPKKYLEYKLRWCDKWAYESIQEDSPIVNWKEGVSCPSCTSGEKIKYARLVEPFQHLATALDNFQFDDYSLSQYSVGDSGSYDTASVSAASRSASDAGSVAIGSVQSQSTMATHGSRPSDLESQVQAPGQPPRYTESPISPVTYNPVSQRSQSYSPAFDYPVSPLNESLNIPIPMSMGSRLSMDLPIPVTTPTMESISEIESISAPSDVSSTRLNTAVSSADSMFSSGVSLMKSKSPSRTARFASSIRRKPTMKERDTVPLPKDPSFTFSSAGHSLLLWAKGANHLVRFDIPSNDTSAIQGCKHELEGIEVAAAGNHKCAIIAASGPQTRKLVIFGGINLTPEFEIELNLSGRLGDMCLAVSRNDKFVATSMNDQIQLFSLESGIKPIAFHHQIHVYEFRGGIQHRRTIPVGRTTSDESIHDPGKTTEAGWFSAQHKNLSPKERAEEQQRQTAIISRKIYFSPDSKRLVVATQLGDHNVYIDVWDVTKEPVSTISEHSRSFRMPPYSLNDGDLTCVFFDSFRRSAIVTAFLGKEYPVLIPFPGYDPLQNETYSTKIVHAAQSPSGLTFVSVNAMTEIIQFEYTPKGTLSPRKLKKSSGKISSGVFKPGAIALAMPQENVLQMFWVKDGKCMLRSVKIGTGETFKDYDIRPHYDRLMSLKNKPVIARAPSLMIPELDGSGLG